MQFSILEHGYKGYFIRLRFMMRRLRDHVYQLLSKILPWSGLRVRLQRMRGVSIGKNVMIGPMVTLDDVYPNFIIILMGEQLFIKCCMYSRSHTAYKTSSGQALNVGLMVHKWCEEAILWKLGKGAAPGMPENPQAALAINAFREWVKANEVEWMAAEKQVYSRKYGYAGTADAVARVNGEFSVIDFKTSKKIYKPYHLQVAAYAKAIGRMYDTKPWGLILRLDKGTGKFQEKVFNPEPHYEAFDLCLKLRKWGSTRIKNEFSPDLQGPDGR